MKTRLLSLLTGSFLALGLAPAAWAQSPNLVKGGDFENLKAWETAHPDAGKVALVPHPTANEGSFVRLSPESSTFARLHIIQQNFVPPPEGGSYVVRYRVWIDGDYAGASPHVSVNVFQSKDTPPEVVAKNRYHGLFQAAPPKDAERGKWTKVELPFTIPANCPLVYVQLVVLGSTGFVDFDDLEIVAVEGKK
jgi:hypothetical protein